MKAAAAIGGGLAPIIATPLLSTAGGTTVVGLYLRALGLLAAVCRAMFEPPALDAFVPR